MHITPLLRGFKQALGTNIATEPLSPSIRLFGGGGRKLNFQNIQWCEHRANYVTKQLIGCISTGKSGI